MSHVGQPSDDRVGTRTGRADIAEVEALRAAERRLQRAQPSSDVAALDRLIDDRLVFTGPDSDPYSKQDDLHAHRSGRQSMTRVDEEDLAVLVVGGTVLTWFLGTLEGTLAGEPFSPGSATRGHGFLDEDKGWRLLAAHVSPADRDTVTHG
jgi:hypothetical protein